MGESSWKVSQLPTLGENSNCIPIESVIDFSLECHGRSSRKLEGSHPTLFVLQTRHSDIYGQCRAHIVFQASE